MISVLNTRAYNHEKCEDSVYAFENEHIVMGCIADGCSTGKNSHFASQLFCYAAKNNLFWPSITDGIILGMMADINSVKDTLLLDADHFLSTCILFIYTKSDKTLKIRIFGDAYYYVDDIEHIVDQNNAPDYIGYHLDDSKFDINTYLSKYPEIIYANVDRFMICSDGIKRIERSDLLPIPKEYPNLLFYPPKSRNYLVRMWNILKRTGYYLSDDLSIVSYVEKSE